MEIQKLFLVAIVLPGLSWSAQGSSIEDATLEEVVVSARKREENVQQTPVTMAVMSARDIETRTLASLVDLGQFTSSTNFSQSAVEMGSAVSAAFFIRGVGQIDFPPTTETGVGLYVDNVYIARSPGAVLDLADVQQVEILKGPQGTLFGKNTIGGAINITTKSPEFDRFSGASTLTAGEWHRLNVDADLNVPLNSQVAARFAVGYRSKDGFVERPNAGDRGGEDNTLAARGKLAAHLGDSNELLLAGDYTHTDANASTMSVVAFDPASSLMLSLFNLLVGVPNGAPMTAANTLSPNDRTDFGAGYNHTDYHGGGASVQLEHDEDAWLLRSVTAYRSLYSRHQRDSDGSPVAFNQDDYLDQHHQWSEELNLIGKAFNQRLNWTAGAYYLREFADSRYHLEIAPGLFQAIEALPAALIPLGDFSCPGGPACAGGAGNPLNVLFDLDFVERLHVSSRSAALFGDLEWAFTPRFSGFTGVRYTMDMKSYFVSSPRIVSGAFIVAPTSLTDQTWNKLSPRIGMKWQATDGLMLYATLSQGFKAGGFNPRPGDQAAALKPFDSEQVWAYELGIKSDWRQQRLRLNSALFHYDYRDMQLLAAEVEPGQVLTSEVIDNVGKARLDGAELDVTAVLTQRLTLQASASYLDARYLDSAYAITGIYKNTPLQKAAKWTGTTAAQYQRKLSGGSILLRADYAYTSANYPDVRATPALQQRAHGLVNSRASWTNEGGQWMFAVYGKNLFDTHYIQNGIDARDSQGSVIAVPNQPREVGVQVSNRF